jgi:hypothetical protein
VEHEDICEVCAQGKNAKKPFPRSDINVEGALDIIHLDMCGPMSATSLRRYVYYVLFIDHFSCKTWIYFLKSKSEVFNKFKEFKALVENIFEKEINISRSYNGR